MFLEGLSSLFGIGPGSVTNGLFGNNGGLLESLTNPSSWWDKFKNGRTNEVNKQIADENLAYQQERNNIEDERYIEERDYNRAFAEDDRAYQRALQQEIFNREDTAIERQASSLANLGINPAGQSMQGLGAGQAVSQAPAPAMSTRGGQALHNDFVMQDSGIIGAIAPLMSLFQGVSDLQTGNLTRDSLRAETDYQRLINQSQFIENQTKALKLQKEIENLQADTENKKANTESTQKSNIREEDLHPYEVQDKKASAERNQRVNEYQDNYGVNDSTTNTIKMITDLQAQADRFGYGPISTVGKESPIEKGVNSFTNSMKIVGNALNNTIGNGARAIYKYFTKPRNKSKKFASPVGGLTKRGIDY